MPTSVDVTPSGEVVVAGNGHYDFGVGSVTELIPASKNENATIVMLSKSGHVVSVSKLRGSIAQAKMSADGKNLIAIGSFGLASIDPTATKINWLKTLAQRPTDSICPQAYRGYRPSDMCRVAVGVDGTSAVFTGGPGRLSLHQ